MCIEAIGNERKVNKSYTKRSRMIWLPRRSAQLTASPPPDPTRDSVVSARVEHNHHFQQKRTKLRSSYAIRNCRSPVFIAQNLRRSSTQRNEITGCVLC